MNIPNCRLLVSSPRKTAVPIATGRSGAVWAVFCPSSPSQAAKTVTISMNVHRTSAPKASPTCCVKEGARGSYKLEDEEGEEWPRRLLRWLSLERAGRCGQISDPAPVTRTGVGDARAETISWKCQPKRGCQSVHETWYLVFWRPKVWRSISTRRAPCDQTYAVDCEARIRQGTPMPTFHRKGRLRLARWTILSSFAAECGALRHNHVHL